MEYFALSFAGQISFFPLVWRGRADFRRVVMIWLVFDEMRAGLGAVI